MTNESAHQMLRLEYGIMTPTNPKSDALKLALQALEKQVPKPVVIISNVHPVIDGNGAYVDADFEDWVACPCCDSRVGFWHEELYMDSFCSNCGQALKEPDDDEL